MKNVVIALLLGILVSGMDVWQYGGTDDRLCVVVSVTVMAFVVISNMEDRSREHRMKKWRAERFGRKVKEIQEHYGQKNRP